MRAIRFVPVVVLGLSSMLVGAGSAGAAGASSYTCTGGNIPSGTYSSVSVTGSCFVPSGTVNVKGNLSVAKNALLDAMAPEGYGGPSPADLPGIVTVGGNVTVGRGAVLFLGCNPAIDCPNASTIGQDIVKGSVSGHGALGVVVHAVTIHGSASVAGGGGGKAQLAGGVGSGDCDSASPPALWASDPALDGIPVYSDFEDNTIDGSLSITGLKTCWTGALRNVVSKNLVVRSNKFGDPDSDEVDQNTVDGNMTCQNNDHAVQFGDSGSTSNVVSGNATGECAFNTSLWDESLNGGQYEPITVKPSSD
jgi:hypothetical protein